MRKMIFSSGLAGAIQTQHRHGEACPERLLPVHRQGYPIGHDHRQGKAQAESDTRGEIHAPAYPVELTL